MVTTRGKGESDAAAESTDTLKTVIQSIIRGDSATLSIEILSQEGVTTIDDLVFLQKEDLQQMRTSDVSGKVSQIPIAVIRKLLVIIDWGNIEERTEEDWAAFNMTKFKEHHRSMTSKPANTPAPVPPSQAVNTSSTVSNKSELTDFNKSIKKSVTDYSKFTEDKH